MPKNQKELDRLVIKKSKELISSGYIARWKIFHPIETLLARLADHSFAGKSLYVLFYKVFDNKYYKGGLPALNKTIDTYMGGVVPSRTGNISKLI